MRRGALRLPGDLEITCGPDVRSTALKLALA
jgi:hypothetical protein